ncbi:MAG: hypothetical protein NW224_03880 [Leptolyngbyaceae cyanobacterium bins.302]|nr:hypothetical protein [Leptolyngbyaceae cyanobacterium bins.302]
MTQFVFPHLVKNQMGTVFTQITVANLSDLLKAEDGIIREAGQSP